MEHERTAWAEGLGLAEETVEALTLISEESARRAGEQRPELDPRDLYSWSSALADAGQRDLAERVDRLPFRFAKSTEPRPGWDPRFNSPDEGERWAAKLEEAKRFAIEPTYANWNPGNAGAGSGPWRTRTWR